MRNNTVDLMTDIAESGLDTLMDSLTNSEFIINVPVIGSFVKLYRAYNDYRAYRFCRRLKKIIDGAENLAYDRDEICKLYNNHHEYLFLHLLNVIDSIEEEEKIDIITNLFRAFLMKKIDKEEFRRFIHITSSNFYYDLKWLDTFIDRIFAHESLELQGLIGTCLVAQDGEDRGGMNINNGGYYYIRTEAGQKFCEMAFHEHG